MAHMEPVESLQLLKNQDQRGSLQGMNIEFRAWPSLLLSYFIGICCRTKCSQILMTAGTRPLHEAMAKQLVSIILRFNTLLGGQGTQGKVKLAHHPAERYAILLLIICSAGFMITGAHGELHNDVDIRSWCMTSICSAPHVWEIRDYAIQALAVTISAAMATIGVLLARGLFQNRTPVPAIPIPPALPTIPAADQALPVIPVVQGGGDDIDDVLARAPIPTRLNSPLSWL